MSYTVLKQTNKQTNEQTDGQTPTGYITSVEGGGNKPVTKSFGWKK